MIISYHSFTLNIYIYIYFKKKMNKIDYKLKLRLINKLWIVLLFYFILFSLFFSFFLFF